MLKKLFRPSGFKLGLAITLIFCAAKFPVLGFREGESFQFLNKLENVWLDWKFVLRGGPAGPEEIKKFQDESRVVIVAIDEKSLRMKDLGMFPWPRSNIATLVENLNKCGAKVIGFDVVFSEPDSSRTAPVVQAIQKRYNQSARKDEVFRQDLDRILSEVHGDQIFAKVLEDTENVVLGYFFFMSEDEIKTMNKADLLEGRERIGWGAISYLKTAADTVLDKSMMTALGVRANLEILSEAVEHYGYFNMAPERDRIYRRVPMVIEFEGKAYPSLSLQVLSLYYGHPISLFVDLDFSEGGELIAYPGVMRLVIGPLDRSEGGHVDIPVESGGMFRVNYYGKARTFRHVSAGDVIHLEPEACRAVKDKVAIVGATSIGIYDHRPMPFQPDYPGVEIHASLIENVLTGNFMIRPLEMSVFEGMAMLLLGILLSWFLNRFRLTVGLIVTILLFGSTAFIDFMLFKQGLLTHIVLPGMHLLVLFLGVAVYRYATEEREKSRIRHAFQFYLSGSVIDSMLHDLSKLKLGGERRVLTVLFSDIRGFTTISEGLPPEKLTELLNEYLTPMTDLVFKYNGTLDKYMGDAIMAFFGAPVHFEDHARAACRTALEMMDKLAQMQASWQERGLPQIDIGIGINTGPMSVGNMGSANRFDYTVMGDHVNLGSRLEGLNKEYGTHIIISEYTREAIGDHFTCRELDAVQVKGKNEPVRIFELVHSGPPNSAKDGWIETFHRALAAFKKREWDQAMSGFEQLQEDAVAKKYIERCQQLKTNPPGEDWDGVVKMKTK